MAVNTSSSLNEVLESLLPVFMPAPATFTTPMLEKFAANHDELMENESIFTDRADVNGIRIDLDGIERTLSRQEVQQGTMLEVEHEDVTRSPQDILRDVRQARLRRSLREKSGSITAIDGSLRSKATISKAARERKLAFDKEIALEEQKALDDFKKGLRGTVLLV